MIRAFMQDWIEFAKTVLTYSTNQNYISCVGKNNVLNMWSNLHTQSAFMSSNFEIIVTQILLINW